FWVGFGVCFFFLGGAASRWGLCWSIGAPPSSILGGFWGIWGIFGGRHRFLWCPPPQDLYVYISEHEHFTDFNVSSALFWQKRDLVYGDWTSGDNADGCYEHYGEVDISQSVQQNGSIYIHVYFTKSGFHPDPRQKNLYRRLATVHTSRMINKYKRRRFQKTKNLLTGETEADPEMIKVGGGRPIYLGSPAPFIWHLRASVALPRPLLTSLSPPLAPPDVKFDAISGDYYPILYFNDYWNLQKDYFPINESLQRLPFRLSFCPLSLWRWQLYAAQSTKSPWNFLGEDLYEQSDEEQDSVKVRGTNPYLLALTIVVSIVHSVFEFLAFKNDIQFWNSRQSLEGLSVRSVFFGVFQSLVVLLYILDNETNFVVQVSVFIGLLIDLWKITKVMDVRLDREHKVGGLLPRPTFTDKSTYIESSTKVYDDMAFRYLSWILFPLLGCYAVYSLLYLEHKGWYSWVLSMLYGFLLTFGFITMTPQLFINYKLKSVAHLPWRMLTYKALNTFIDDLFAFVIKMPMMYRIGCLRDGEPPKNLGVGGGVPGLGGSQGVRNGSGFKIIQIKKIIGFVKGIILPAGQEERGEVWGLFFWGGTLNVRKGSIFKIGLNNEKIGFVKGIEGNKRRWGHRGAPLRQDAPLVPSSS
uniref:CLPTM1 regulator of GABA type A receptor forward trafficking n=1 Tax=Anas zonorhyncha TaxID=75864 RepID=A0A8B9ZWN0_9AVES